MKLPLNEEMKMIRHETIGIQIKGTFFGDYGERGDT